MKVKDLKKELEKFHDDDKVLINIHDISILSEDNYDIEIDPIQVGDSSEQDETKQHFQVWLCPTPIETSGEREIKECIDEIINNSEEVIQKNKLSHKQLYKF